MTLMKQSARAALVIALTAGMLQAQQPLPITRVLLAKNGMAYIVRGGQLKAPLSLTFHPEDMNDVLKSFTAWNPDSGALYSVGYTSGVPSSHMLGRYPFDLTGADVGLGSFLGQVKGANIRLDTGGKPLEGKLLAAQKTDHVLQQQTSATDYRLTVLLADGSLQTVWLSEVRSVEFPDPVLRNQLKQYLETLSEGRQDVTREVSVYPGAAPGPVRVAYLQQFPLWKTSYRMDLGASDSQIQGWAQIDNPTGESWENVEVSLLSGSPVSFVMNLYEPLFTRRASVAVPGGQVASPRQYESAVRSNDGAGRRAANDTLGGLPLAMMNTIRDGLSVTDGFSAGRVGSNTILNPDMISELRMTLGPVDAESGRGNAQVQIATSRQAQTTEMQDFFEYRFPFPVQLAGRQSALLPFLQKKAPTERLSIYNPRSDRGNPRLGVRIENSTDIPFEPGPITFFEEGRYAGEAVLSYLPRTEKRLVSYGVDYDIQIATKPKATPERMVKITAARGVVTLHAESVLTTTYEIRNKGTTAKTLIIEHARLDDRKLKALKPWETTDNYYRFRVTLAPGEMTELTPDEIVSSSSEVALTDLDREEFVRLFSSSETPQALRAKLGQIVDVQERISALEQERGETEARSNTLFNDQQRLRENLKALRDSREEQSLRSRYLDQLTKQEDQIQASRARVDSLQNDVTAARKRLADLISALSWE
jgi:hypothetical protein